MTPSPAPTATTTEHLRLRRLPVPVCEPPFDDEIGRSPVQRARLTPVAVQGTLALSFVLPSGLPAAPRPALHLVPAGRAVTVADPDVLDFGPQPTARAVLPEPRAWAGRLVQAVVEVLAGDRPLTQLVRWTTSEVYDEVADLLPSGRRARLRQAGRMPDEQARASVRSVHVVEPADGIAEVAATVRRGRRTTAVALRLEGLDGRWQCTALEVG